MIKTFKVERVLAWLIRNGGVDPAVIEEAVTSANTMKLGEAIPLTGDNEPLRRVFVQEQARRLSR